MAEILKKGADSGDVPNKVKLQIFVKGVGICAAPDCSERLMQNKTKLGECAHIIPRKVGSHPREDYATPLDNRNKEPNLLYLCEKHHKIVDDPQHAKLYTAQVLRDWKNRHEEWAARITKNSLYFPVDLFARVERQISEEAKFSQEIIGQLLDTSRELLDRQLIDEARVLLSQIDLLLLGAKNRPLSSRADLLSAILMICNEQIPQAKQQLLQIIQANPDNVEAMLEYVELCSKVPEPDDNAESIEQLARSLASEHPRLMLIDLARKFHRQEIVDIPDFSENWTDDITLNARFLRQYALFCDLAQRTSERDELVNRWESELPNSPRPHLFRVLFSTLDLRSTVMSPQEKVRSAQELLRFSQEERDKAATKDPIHIRDQISWLMQEIRLEDAYIRSSGATPDVDDLRNRMISLVEQCFFDSFINNTLSEFLSTFRIEPNQWETITRKIQESNVSPSNWLVEALFLEALRYEGLHADLDKFIKKYGYNDLSTILYAVKERDAEVASQIVNAMQNSNFTLYLLESVADDEFALALTELLEVDHNYQIDLLYARLKFLYINKRDNEALDIIRSLPLDGAGPHALRKIARVTYQNNQWDLFIASALQLLEFNISQSDRSQLHSQLATAYFERGDDSNVIIYAEKALSQASDLGDENLQILLERLGRSLAMKGQYDEAFEKFQQYGHIERSFPLFLQEAELYLKSNFTDKHEKSLDLMIKAFEETDVYSNELYLSAGTLLIELDNAGVIPKQDEPRVDDGLFIKLDGFSIGWFYIGEEKYLGAECIRPGTPNYEAIINKEIGDEVEWPADKFTKPNTKRKILHVVTAPAFLSHRAHEVLMVEAEIGNAPVWSVQATNEDGSLDKEKLLQFFQERLQTANDAFDKYINTPLPFAFLCKVEGGLGQALGRIVSEKRGFIRLNDATQADIEAQMATANEVLQGAICFIDGLSALMLAEAGLLEAVVKALPDLGVSTSVIRLLRQIAGEFINISGSIGRLNIVDGKLQFIPRSKENDEALSNLLLGSADLLDQLPNKVIGKTYREMEGDRNLDHLLPDYAVDAFRYSQEKDAYLLTDDVLLVQAYKQQEETAIPRHFSSLSLIRAMTESKLLTWDEYLEYFARLSTYRYHLLPISVDDMIQTVLPTSPTGLVIPTPKKIGFLNLPLTLSEEYGVNDMTAARILSSFFSKLILDDSLPTAFTDEIFALTIVQGLTNRDKRTLARAVFQICQKIVQDRNWLSPLSQKKLAILDKQLSGFAQGFDPLIFETH